MTLLWSDAVANATLNAIETAIGTSPVIKILSGATPANCAAADSGTVLATFSLQSDWMNDASSRGKAKKTGSTIEDASADEGGMATHYRIFATGGTTCHGQGPVVMSGSTGLVIDDVNITKGQKVTISNITFADYFA
jgi:hypothetical protein